ncbi:PilZ domain-containing protein [Sphingomicrobium marinum]|uniref:PilZ domain-containing protein n=1 Tax=Sphingomicrobium marinum TaxID=1227950 RepID=UPI00223F15F3|nr:PilZ domain-containing protein [Sphingomicrobium marinum]
MNSFRNSIGKPRPQREPEPLLLDKGQHVTREDDLTSVSIRRHAHRSATTRICDRHRLTSEEVIVYTDDGTESVAELINVSQGGAMIETDLEVELWQPLALDFGDAGVLECAVRWIRDKRIGVEYISETQFGCDPAMRDTILLETIRKSFPSYAVRGMDIGHSTSGGAHKKRASSETRVARRHPLIWSGEIHYHHDTHEVRIRNISESGAMIECAKPLPVDAGLLLDLGKAGQIFSFVSWCRGGHVGLAFEELYDVSRLAEARPQVAAPGSGWVAPDYLRKTPHPKSPWSDRWESPTLEKLREDLEGFLGR